MLKLIVGLMAAIVGLVPPLWVVAILTVPVAWVAPGKALCYQKVRKDVQIVHGHRFDRYHKRSAHLSYLAWKKSPHARSPKRGVLLGDIVLWKATPGNPHGHAAIVVWGNRYAENSSVHWRGRHWGKGFRDRRRVRPPDLIVRLPAPRALPF